MVCSLILSDRAQNPNVIYYTAFIEQCGGELEYPSVGGSVSATPSKIFFVYQVLSATSGITGAKIDSESRNYNEVWEKIKKGLIANHPEMKVIKDDIRR